MPMIPVDTAVQVMVGPLVDDTDFKTRETGVAYNAAGMDVDLLKSSDTGTPTTTAITLTSGGTSDWVELSGGYYYAEVTAAQNDTEGKLKLIGIATGILPFQSVEYDVVPQQVYNSLVAGSDDLDVQVAGMDANTITAGVIQNSAITASNIASNAITAAKIAADAIGSSEIADGAITAGTFAAGAIDATAIATGAIDADSIASDAITAAKIATDAVDADALAADAVTEIAAGISVPTAAAIADAVSLEAIADHSGTAGSNAEAWAAAAAVGTGTGSSQMTVTVQDDASAAVPGVNVAVYDSGNTTLTASGTTNGSGQIVFALADGTYKARCVLTGWGFTIPETLTVSGTSTATITATAAAAAAPSTTTEDVYIGRQKVRYNDDNDDNALEFQLVHNGAKITPASATITIYAPGNTTAKVGPVAMTVTGSVMTYSVDTTTTSDYAIDQGYRADIIVTDSGGTTYEDKIVFDVAKFILQLPIGYDQIVALDDGVAGMTHDGDVDFSKLIETVRRKLQTKIESHVISGGRMLEEMILDHSRVVDPALNLILMHIWHNKGNEEKSLRYEQWYKDSMETALSSISYDEGQDGEESGRVGSDDGVRLET